MLRGLVATGDDARVATRAVNTVSLGELLRTLDALIGQLIDADDAEALVTAIEARALAEVMLHTTIDLRDGTVYPSSR